MKSAHKWKAHTSTTNFATAFDHITTQYAHDNERRTQKIEEFLISEALKAGVLKCAHDRIQNNPNKWSKHLAPWFDDACKQEKYLYR